VVAAGCLEFRLQAVSWMESKTAWRRYSEPKRRRTATLGGRSQPPAVL